MTWGDIKIITLQKMFAISGDTLIKDDTTNPYILSMPAVANEALQLLSTAGRYIRKTLTIEQLPPGTDPETSTADIKEEVREGLIKYDLSELTDDFYSLWKIYKETAGAYGETGAYKGEGESILVFDASECAKWTVYYNAYPKEITRDTPDSEELALHPEVYVLLPLYMASQLYKDDDIGQSTQLRNEFEVGRETLLANANRHEGAADSFYSQSGWW